MATARSRSRESLVIGCLAVFFAHLGGGAAWRVSSFGLQRETPDWIRDRVFSADYGFLTLTMAMSSIGVGLASDYLGPFAATLGTASMCIVFAIVWSAWTWRMWA